MTTILVPFHQDETLDATGLPVPADDVIAISPALPDGDVWTRLATLYESVAAAVALNPGATVVSGDCLVSAAVVAGVQRNGHDPVVVWFDAHGDVHTLETSTSGYLGGLALRLLLGAHRELLADRIGLRPVAPDRAVLVDARDLDPAEAEYLATAGIRRRPVHDLGELPAGPVVLHVDVDVVDPGELDRLRYPAPGGPSARDVVAAVRHLRATREIVAFDIACPWYPVEDDAPRAALLAALNAAVPPGP